MPKSPRAARAAAGDEATTRSGEVKAAFFSRERLSPIASFLTLSIAILRCSREDRCV
jgi:hypothetical protein